MQLQKGPGLSRRSFVAGATAVTVAATWPDVNHSMPSPRALELAEARRSELSDLLRAMVRVRSLSGESAAEAQEVVKTFLAGLPYRIEESADRPSRYEDHAEFMHPDPPGDGPFVNVIGWPERRRGGRHAMFAHIDTHIIADGWETEPLEPVMVGNRLHGLGTSDDKGGVAAMLVAAAALGEAGEALPVVMSLHGKGGGSRGSLPVFERLRTIDHGIDAVLYVHPAETGRGLDDVKTEVLGVLDLELKVRGWRAPPMEIGSVDSSSWEDGGNAIDACWAALERLRDTAFRDVRFNLGTLQGGDRVGSVADDATASFRLKFAGEHTWRTLLAAGRKELAAFSETFPASQPGFDLRLEPSGYRTNPGAADWDAPVSRVLRDAISDIKGRPPDAYPNHYAGDIRYPIRLLGVPAYGVGSIGGNFYGPNEWVDVDDLVRLVAVLVQTLSGWSAL